MARRKRPAPEPSTGQLLIPEASKASMEAIRDKAAAWAERSGLKPPFSMTGPDRVDFPERGHGYVIVVQEAAGDSPRMGTARFDADGRPTMWSIDGIARV